MILDDFPLTDRVAATGVDGGTTAPAFAVPIPPLQPQAEPMA